MPLENNTRINVTKTFLPPLEEYNAYLEGIWARDQLTNQGPLVNNLENKLKKYLGVENFHFVTNGTLALLVAIEALGIRDGEIITTPFSYVATTGAILWERCKPVFVDISPDTLCIDVDKIEDAITPNTKAIMAVHVFGIPCEVEKIDALASRHNLKVIYDGAHAFGVELNGKSVLRYGDISTCSFHATKLFHTVEGGCVIAGDKDISDKIELIKRFGHDYDNHLMLGINAKASELQAAMGLCNLKYIDEIIQRRKQASELYDKLLSSEYTRPKAPRATKYNYAYYPVVFENERSLLHKFEELKKENIFPRRYFYPSLNKLPYIDDQQDCPTSEEIASKIACLPLYPDIPEDVISKICEVMNK